VAPSQAGDGRVANATAPPGAPALRPRRRGALPTVATDRILRRMSTRASGESTRASGEAAGRLLPPDAAIVGVVLAGGASRRMGVDKALVPFAGATLVERAVARLGRQVAAVALARDPGLAVPSALAGLPCLADPPPGREGPLSGILAGLLWARSLGASRLQVVPVDAPFLPLDLVNRLAQAVPEDVIAVAASQGRMHPVVALIPTRFADDLAESLAVAGGRSVVRWLERGRVATVPFEPAMIGGGPVDPFLNLNTPQDLAAAEAALGEHAGVSSK